MGADSVNNSTESEVSQSQLVTRLYAEAELLHRKGHSLSEIRDRIVKAGIHQDDANQMIETLSGYLQQKDGEIARRNVFYGSLWLLGAIGAGAAIYTADLSIGAWLAAVVGGILGLTLLLRGIMQLRGEKS
ncbi:MAG: hypothetical protein VB817_01440 [Pirellulaceae bacterium]